MHTKRKAEEAFGSHLPVTAILKEMWRKIDRIQGSPEPPISGDYCRIHGGRVMECNKTRLVFEKNGLAETYVSKVHLLSLVVDNASRNRLHNNYSKEKLYGDLVLTFHVNQNCSCVATFKKGKIFRNSHVAFILESGLQKEYSELLKPVEPAKKKLEKMSFEFILN